MLFRRAFLVGLCLAASMTSAVADDGKIFRIWWFETPGNAMSIAWEKAIDTFKAKHPGVEVRFEQKSWDQMLKAGTLVLNSDSTPDLLEYSKGNATAGLAASLGLLEDLDQTAEQRGWTKVLSPAQLALGRYDERGVFGSGPLVGIPNYAEFVTVYYNKDMFAANGLAVPKTLAEMEGVMDAFVKKGVTPLAVAANDYPATHLWYELALSKVDRAWVDSYQSLKTKLDTAPFLHASQTLQDWVNKGYLSKDSTGLTASDMVGQFQAGKAPMVVTGTWYAKEFSTKITSFQWDNFLFPGNSLQQASTGNIWVVPKAASNKELAYDFIDITLSEENQRVLGEAGGVALNVAGETLTDPIGRSLTQTARTIMDANGLGYYPDWPAPGFYEVIRQKVQALIGGTLTPEAAVEAMASAYDEAQAEAQ